MHRLFRLLALLFPLTLLFSTPAATASPPVAPRDTVFGINSHLASRYPNYQTLSQPAGVLADTGAGWAREDFQWHRIEPQPGRFDWGFTDRVVELLTARGINIVGVLGPSVGWATPFAGDKSSNVSFYPPDPQRYAAFAQAVVAHYRGRVSYWEVWNEPDNAHYWQPAPDPAAYARLLQTAAPAIKAANPEAKVLLGGLVPFDLSFLRAIGASGAWSAFDILSLHPYVDPASPEGGQIGVAGVGAAKALADSLGPKPIWVTEVGWATGPGDRDPAGKTDEATQANFLVRAAALLRAAGAERVLWYSFKDEGRFNPYGLLRYGAGQTDYSQPKPALVAFHTLAQQLAGTTLVGTQDLGGQQVIDDFETFGCWQRGNQANGTLTASSTQTHSGTGAAQLNYRFPTSGNDYVVFQPRPALAIPGTPSQLGLWVSGDGNGHSLKVWLRDATGETLQFRLGFVGGGGWQFLAAPITGQVEAYNRVSGKGNGRLDFPVTLTAIVLDDEPDSFVGSGTIFLDDLTAISGPEAYDVRFARDDTLIDLLWAPTSSQASLPVTNQIATLVNRDGASTAQMPVDGQVRIDLGPSPVYLIRAPVPLPTLTPTTRPRH